MNQYIINQGLTFSFVFINSFFDSNDYEKPIKYYVDDKFYWPIQATQMKKSNIYIKRNTAELRDSYFGSFSPSKELSYYQVENF